MFERKNWLIRQEPRRTFFKFRPHLAHFVSVTSTSWSRTTRINYTPKNVHRYPTICSPLFIPQTRETTFVHLDKHLQTTSSSPKHKSSYCADRFDTRDTDNHRFDVSKVHWYHVHVQALDKSALTNQAQPKQTSSITRCQMKLSEWRILRKIGTKINKITTKRKRRM